MHKLIIILALLISAPAFAANLTWSITTDAGTVTQASPTISTANMDRFVDWLWYAYPQLDAEGNPLARTPAREATAFRAWAQSQWHGTKANVMRWERQEAARAAQEAITDIEN